MDSQCIQSCYAKAKRTIPVPQGHILLGRRVLKQLSQTAFLQLTFAKHLLGQLNTHLPNTIMWMSLCINRYAWDQLCSELGFKHLQHPVTSPAWEELLNSMHSMCIYNHICYEWIMLAYVLSNYQLHVVLQRQMHPPTSPEVIGCCRHQGDISYIYFPYSQVVITIDYFQFHYTCTQGTKSGLKMEPMTMRIASGRSRRRTSWLGILL